MGSVEQIDNWLDSKRDLEAGRALLDQFASAYGINAAILKMIHTYSNSGTVDLIAAELTDIKKQILSAARPKPKNLRPQWSDIEYEKLTPELKELFKKVKVWYQELDTDRGKSRATPEGDALRDLMLNVIRLRKKIERSIEKLIYYQEYGVEMDPHVAEMDRDAKVEQLTTWLRAMKANPPYISKNKSSTDDRVKKEVRRRQKELEAINQYLADAN